MALDPNSAIGQSETANNALAGYFAALSTAMEDDTGAQPIPSTDDLVAEFDYSELLRMATTRASDSASYENGAAVENIHMMAAIDREYSLRTKSKLDYYTDAAAEFLDESNFYATMKVYWVNMLNGIYKEGGGV